MKQTKMITVRLTEEQHAAIVTEAANQGTSVNNYCLSKLLDRPVKQVGGVRGRKSKVLRLQQDQAKSQTL